MTENLQMGGFFQSREAIEAGLEHAFGLFSAPARTGAPARRHHVGWRAADAGHRPRADEPAPSAAARRTPHWGLAPLIIAQIFEIIQKIRTEGVTVFLVEQNANRALQLADRGYVLENGRIVLQDTGSNLLANEEVRKAYLGV